MSPTPASAKPVSDLRRRMLEDMAVRRFGEKTRHDYVRHIETFTRFLGRSPDTATPVCASWESASDTSDRHLPTATW